VDRIIEDLRFFIGAFFLIIGALLVIESAFNSSMLDLGCGTAFVLFAAGPLYFAIRAARK